MAACREYNFFLSLWNHTTSTYLFVLDLDPTTAQPTCVNIFPQVCSEEILSEIQDRYLKYNAHAASYTWKYNGRNLDMNKTLQENGVIDESEEFYKLRMNNEQFLPALHLYFNDDLTEA